MYLKKLTRLYLIGDSDVLLPICNIYIAITKMCHIAPESSHCCLIYYVSFDISNSFILLWAWKEYTFEKE